MRVVLTLGTTGTAMGILCAMKERNPAIEVIGVEPYPGHRIQGLKNMKESYVPGIFDRYSLDRIVHVKDEDAFEMARRLAREEGIFAGDEFRGRHGRSGRRWRRSGKADSSWPSSPTEGTVISAPIFSRRSWNPTSAFSIFCRKEKPNSNP